LIIKAYSKINEDIVKQIKEVENLCKVFDGTKGSISLDTSLNIHSDMKALFLLYENTVLVSILSIFMPTAEEAEISAYTLPAFRRKGYFKELLKEAEAELQRYGQPDLIFVNESNSKSGAEAAKKLGGRLEFTEYFLRYQHPIDRTKEQTDRQIKLQEATEKDLETIIGLSQRIFDDSYEDAESMVKNTLNAENRIQYIAVLWDEPIGMGSVSQDNDTVSIHGLGIVPEYQGKGYGKELLTVIIQELQMKGISDITLEVNSSNDRAFQLYTKYGFTIDTSYDYYRVE
jgi:ribosomal protein S18 acetylase RimI-like enzyme